MIKKLLLFVILWVFMTPVNAEGVKSIEIDGTTYLHRWSQGNQHEFTPKGQADLKNWKDMMTISVFPEVSNGNQLAQIANGVLSNYQNNGAILIRLFQLLAQ